MSNDESILDRATRKLEQGAERIVAGQSGSAAFAEVNFAAAPADCELLQAAHDDSGAFAIARYVDNKPIHDRLLLRLKTNGSFAAATTPLDLQGWSAATDRQDLAEAVAVSDDEHVVGPLFRRIAQPKPHCSPGKAGTRKNR